MVLVRVVDGSKSGVVEVWEMALDGVVGRRRVLAREGCGRWVRGVIQSDRLLGGWVAEMWMVRESGSRGKVMPKGLQGPR